MIPIEVSVVLPCLNEAETLATCIQKARQSFTNLEINGEVIVADNGSTDGSQKIALDSGAKLISIKERGYGSALIGGFKAASGQYIIMGDADDSYYLEELAPFIHELRAGADLVMGDRFSGTIQSGAMPFLHRWLGNPVLSFLGRLMFGSNIRDFHCGLRGMRRESVLKLNLQTTGMEFASELVVKFIKQDLKISQVPTNLRKDGRSRPPHLRTWRDGWRHLRFLLSYSPRWLFLYPGMLLTGLGASLLFLFLTGPKSIGNMKFDLLSLITSSFIFIFGIQMMWFSVLSKASSVAKGYLPIDNSWLRIIRIIKSEKNYLVYVLFSWTGFVLLATQMFSWSHNGYSHLNSDLSIRFGISGLTLVAIGIQSFTSQFLLNIISPNFN